MSEQLQSLKYLPAEYLEPEPTAEVTQVQSTASTAPTPNSSSPYASPNPISSNETINGATGKWTKPMGWVSGFISFAGGLGVIQSLWGIWSLFQLEEQVKQISALASRVPNLADSVAVLESQLANWNLLMINTVFGLIVSIGFLASAYMFSKQKENGNVLIAVFCIMAIVFNALAMYVTYLSLAGMPTFQDANGAAGLNVAMGAVGFIIMIKVGIYLAITAFMFTKNTKSLFAEKVSA